MALLFNSVSQYSSSIYEIARNVLRSRTNQAARSEQLTQQNANLKRHCDQLEHQQHHARQTIDTLTQQLRQAQHEIQSLRSQPCRLPDDPPLPHHTYGPKLMSLCINLAKAVGLRASENALEIFFDFFEIKHSVPCWTTIRGWTMRVGVAQLDNQATASDDMIWFADHSNQIGTQKVLTILGISASKLPAPGQTLKHQDVRILSVVPATQWKREDVREEYRKLAAKIGTPRMLLTDGAVELHESADILEKDGKKPLLFRDMKHYAANLLERILQQDDRFSQFTAQLGRTRCAIQQTELGHFTPPSQRAKARFMNLGPTLRWGKMISWQLSHPRSKGRKGVKAQRMNAKLGWVRGFRDDLTCWSRCQHAIDESLRFINTQGIFHGASIALKTALSKLSSSNIPACHRSDTLRDQLIAFALKAESQPLEGERGWLSTEILESAFGLYKAFEGQHSKGGFTSLIAAFPALLTDCTSSKVSQSMKQVSNARLKQWVRQNVDTTLTSKRNLAYAESTNQLAC